MTEQHTPTPVPPTEGTSPSVTTKPRSAPDRFFDSIRGQGLYRRRDHRWIGGVACGIATRLNVDPLLVRVAFILLGMFFGFGVTAYLVAWALLPDEHGVIPAERAWKEQDAGSILLVAVALISLSGLGRASDRRWPLATVLILGALWWAYRSRTGATTPRTGSARPVGSEAGPAIDAPAPSTPQDVIRPGGATATPPPPGWQPPRPAYATAPAGQAARPRRRSGGIFLVLLAAGVALPAYLGTHALAEAIALQGNHDLIAWAAAVGAVGLVLVGAGLAGLRGGPVALVAPLVAFVLAMSTLSGAYLDPHGGVGERTWRPDTVAELTTDFRLGLGEARLDLSGLTAKDLAGRTVGSRVALGRLVLTVPEEVPVRINARVGAGELEWEDTGGNRRAESGGGNTEQTIQYGSGAPAYIVDVEVGAGNLQIVRP